MQSLVDIGQPDWQYEAWNAMQANNSCLTPNVLSVLILPGD